MGAQAGGGGAEVPEAEVCAAAGHGDGVRPLGHLPVEQVGQAAGAAGVVEGELRGLCGHVGSPSGGEDG